MLGTKYHTYIRCDWIFKVRRNVQTLFKSQYAHTIVEVKSVTEKQYEVVENRIPYYNEKIVEVPVEIEKII